MSKCVSFTLREERGLLRILRTDCMVSKAISVVELKQGVPHPPMKSFVAIWDTGASTSAISPAVVNALGLVPTGKGLSDTAAGTVSVDKYCINLMLPCNVGFSTLEVSCNNMKVDVLIGMDIISRGDFCVSNKNGKTLFTFQTPSTHEIDFTKELDKYKKIHEGWIKHGNKKCPCGSGKDWEKCHGEK